ncbi:TetR family transcriptional regulator [Brevibacterium sanguinis]|uniref:TetR family transcriptional regulator n=2 Tax=Brevibacterium TaxID=1696 RepID=A0A366IJF9_9MICO|nr:MULTISPECIES: TetR/AcrR family transcriptional regulator [Brevibacterium]RBP64268.1 TetR family transcriptional regulator [Brevibacterium sanguinis]RBP71440.1 TetR family transcriptional regulator [Brevibacterium celere]
MGEPGTAARPGRRRADAQRNRLAILAATPIALRRNPDASIADIAAEAGVGRMTLYGHFPTRAELIEAAVVDTLDRGDEVLSAVPLDGEPSEALTRLIASSWTLIEQARGLLAAAQKELSAGRIRDLHEKAEDRMRALLQRGQGEGAFRTDLPLHWLLATAHTVMNAAAEEISAGRLDPSRAAHHIDAVLQPAFAPPRENRR